MTMRKLDAVGVVLSLIGRVRDPRERLAALVAVRREIDDHAGKVREEIRTTIAELRTATPSRAAVPIAEIARILQVTPQRAHQLAAPTTTGEPNARQPH